MISVYKKEMKSYMISMIGYMFIAFVLLMEGIYFVAYNLNAAYPQIGVTLSSVTFIFMIVVPILTMRVLAEEQKQKTDQLLLTAPISVADIVWGKYLALLTLFAVPMIVTCVYPLIMSLYGNVDFLNCYVAVLGYFGLGCTSLAIGLLVSSLTENPVISAGVSFVIMFLCFVMSGLKQYLPQTAMSTAVAFAMIVLVVCAIIYYVIKNIPIVAAVGVIGEAAVLIIYVVQKTIFEGALQRVVSVFDLTQYFENFQNGVLDMRGIVYYISVCGVCIFLTMQSIQKRRWS